MSDPNLSAMTPNGISFEVETLAAGAPGQLQITGRWYGVRGRRFVRPTLTVTMKSDGSEQRVLADLEHKPWAAEDGEAWRAAFPLALEPAEASRIELAVAPDISVELDGTSGDGSDRRAPTTAAARARSPVIRDDPARPRPRAPRSPEVERLRERVTLAEAATAKEHTRRETAEETLESERQTVRKLTAEVGRLRAELELAGTVQRELDTATRSLDALRAEVREALGERDQLASKRDEAARRLTGEQAEAERLRSQLADAEAAVHRLTQAGREARVVSPEAEPGPVAEATQRLTLPLAAPANGPRSDPAPLPRGERPVNPSLRSSNWVGRGIALIVIAIVVVAIIVVINSTVA